MRRKQDVTRWIAMGLAAFGIMAACLSSLFLLYGGGNWQRAAQSQASSLSATVVSELVGTSHYQSDQTKGGISLPVALARVFRLPISDPLAMLTSELPAPAGPNLPAVSAQGSLMTSLAKWQAKSHHVELGWLPNESTQSSIQTINDNPGINVVSPEWLQLWSPTGIVKNYSNPAVIKYAHQHHIAVWAMFDNQYSATLTHALLTNQAARARAVQAVAAAVRTDHLDGVNIDFENLYSSDQAAFTQFVQALHRALAKEHAVLSVDITPDIVPLQDNAAYFHAGLAAAANYVVLMAYDEHWSGDSVPGPVADVPWVTRAVNDLLDTGVPADQLILGIPSYTQFWHVYPDGSVSSQALADSAVPGILASHHSTGRWDAQLGVYYARYPLSTGYEEVWYPGPRTWADKLNLVSSNGLAGVAVWSLSLSNAHTWSTVVNALRQSIS